MSVHRLIALLLLSLTGCTHIVWYGRSPDRRHAASVIERGDTQLVRYDFRDETAFKGIGVDALQLTDTRLVYPAQLSNDSWVVVTSWHANDAAERGGSLSTAWDAIGEIVTSDSALLYAAQRKNQWFVVREGVGDSGPWDDIIAGSLRVSSNHWAFAAQRDNKVWVVTDGKQRGPFDAVGQFTLVDEGLLFTTRTVDGTRVLLGEREPLGPFEDATELHFERGELIFATRVGKRWHVGEGPFFERIAGVTWLDGELVYAGHRDGADFIVRGRKELGPFKNLKKQIVKSKAGLVFASRRDDTWWVQRGESESGPWEDMSSLASDGVHDAFIAERNGRSVVVVDGEVQSTWELATSLTFGANGRLIHFALSGTQQLLAHDGKTTPHDLILADTIAFSRGGKHFGCVTGEAKTKKLFISFDDGSRVPLDLEELTAALTRMTFESTLVPSDAALLHRWVEAELAIRFPKE